MFTRFLRLRPLHRSNLGHLTGGLNDGAGYL